MYLLIDVSSAPRVVRVGSRSSELAMVQSRTIISALQQLHPEISCEIVTMNTIGDKILDKSLPTIGQTNLFTKELEAALAVGQVDLIVHSLKDVPTTLSPEMTISVIFERDKSTDALVLHPKHKGKQIRDLPAGSVIGTSSLRRIAQLQRNCPGLVFKTVRGNLNTRLRKLDEAEDYDALVLATAGLERLGWHDRIDQELDSSICMYAVGQGALAVETRAGDEWINTLLRPLNHPNTLLCCVAERGFLHELGGGCSVPVGVSSEVRDRELYIEGAVFSLDGSEVVRGSARAQLASAYLSQPMEEWHTTAGRLGTGLARELLSKGAAPILAKAKEEIESIKN